MSSEKGQAGSVFSFHEYTFIGGTGGEGNLPSIGIPYTNGSI